MTGKEKRTEVTTVKVAKNKNMDTCELAQLLGDAKRAINKTRTKIDEINSSLSDIQESIKGFTAARKELSAMEKKIKREYWYILNALMDEEDQARHESKDDSSCYVYYILNDEKDKVKIGISNDPTKRAKNIQTSSGEEIEILHAIKFRSREEAQEAEHTLHKEFAEHRKYPSKVAKSCEWFDACIVDTLMNDYSSRDDILKLEDRKRKELIEKAIQCHLATRETTT